MISTRKRLDYALGYLELKLLAEAGRELALIAPADRDAAPVLGVRLELAMAQEAWTDVISLAPRCVEADQTDERPWIAWAYALRERRRIAQARDVLLRGESLIASPSVLVDYNLACYFCLLGDLSEARRRLDRVVAREPRWNKDARQDPDLAALHPAPAPRRRDA